MSRTARVPLVALLLLAGIPLAGAQQGPIRLHFDLHVDPVPNGVPLSTKQSVYQERADWMGWVLDQTEPLGVQISFLSTGLWMELCVDEGVGGSGAQLLQRIWASGGQIGGHSHRDHRQGALDWPDYTSPVTLAQSQDVWQDSQDWVNQALLTAFGGAPPEPLADINCVRGSHVPESEPDYHALMQQFGYGIRQPGPEEDYYGWYGHHVWHPFRPSDANPMGEDLSAPFVQPTQGPVIGKAAIHHGVFQDMTAPAVKRQFLQLYVNWRHRDRSGAPERIWCWGWAGHAHDFDPGSPSRADMVDVVGWLDAHFAHKVEPTGSQVLQWSTHRATGAAYFAWEAANPGTSSFSFDSLTVNWQEYPWLRPVAEEMAGFRWTADLGLGGGTSAFQLEEDGTGVPAVLLWRDSGSSVEDLSTILGSPVRAVGLETGNLLGTDPAAVAVAQEPVWVVEDIPCPPPVGYCVTSPNSVGPGALMAFAGSASLGANDFELRVAGAPPFKPGIFFFSPNPANHPFGDGVRCAGGPAFRTPVLQIGVDGTASRQIDLAHPPGPPGLFVPGSVLHWQFWYRDVAGGPIGFNLSDGLRSTFCP